MLKRRTDSTLKLTALATLWIAVTSARIYSFETLLCKIVLTNINSFFAPTQRSCPYHWTPVSPSFFSLPISKHVAQKNWHGVTLLRRTVRRRDWWRCWRQTSDCVQWQVPFPLLWPSRQLSPRRDVYCIEYPYGNMMAWGRRAGLRWFGEHVTMQIDWQDITARDNYKTIRTTKLYRRHIKQGNKTGRKTKPHSTIQQRMRELGADSA